MRVVGLGAGGHAKVVLEILQGSGGVRVDGLLDRDPGMLGRRILGVPVIGDDSLLPSLIADGLEAVFIGLGSVADGQARRRLFRMARRCGLEVVSAVDPQAIISPSARLGAGATIMPGAIINADARLGANVIVNTAAVVEHDCRLDDHSHVATGAKLASTVRVGSGAHIGAGATVLQCLEIGQDAVVGAGAVVTRPVPAGTTVIGAPARPLVREALAHV